MPIYGYALKRLTHTDLTLFEDYFRVNSRSKQKSINMNADVLVDDLYPVLRTAQAPGRLPVDLLIYGPGGVGGHRIQRKILRQEKNWRLNGELVPSPEERPDRYASLRAGDFAIFSFEGAPYPTGLTMWLLSQNDPDDRPAIEALDAAVPKGRGGMLRIETPVLQNLLDDVSDRMPDDHPLLSAALPETVMDLIAGGVADKVLEDTLAKRTVRAMSQAALDEMRARQARIGEDGESIAAAHLAAQLEDGLIEEFDHVSSLNAVSPFDFTCDDARIEVKATSQEHERPFHISTSEIEEAARTGRGTYELWRISRVGSGSPVLLVHHGFAALAGEIIGSFAEMPEWIRPDGFTVYPNRLDGEWIEVELLGQSEA